MDLSQLLSRSANEVKAPPLLPPGTYLFRVTGTDTSRKTSNGNPMVIVNAQAEMPLEVDPSSMEGVILPYKLGPVFILTEASLFRFKNFLLHLGFDENDGSLQYMHDTSIGRTFKGTVVHTVDRKDPSVMRAEIRETSPA